jgi:hypothetical protein
MKFQFNFPWIYPHSYIFITSLLPATKNPPVCGGLIHSLQIISGFPSGHWIDSAAKMRQEKQIFPTQGSAIGWLDR